MGLPPLSEVVVILIPLATSSFQKQSFGSLRKNESLACMMSDSLFCHCTCSIRIAVFLSVTPAACRLDILIHD